MPSWLSRKKCQWFGHPDFEEVDIHPSFQWSKYKCSRCGEVKLVNDFTGRRLGGEVDMFNP